MPKSKGTHYDLCLKAKNVRKSMYKKKNIHKQRQDMCPDGKLPRCVKGLAYCAKRPSYRSGKKSKSNKLRLK